MGVPVGVQRVGGHVEELQTHYGAIGREGGAKFWFHGLRNAFITVVERELMLPRPLTKRLVKHARPEDVTDGHAVTGRWSSCANPLSGSADRIDEFACKTSICRSSLNDFRRFSCSAKPFPSARSNALSASPPNLGRGLRARSPR